MWSPSRPSTLTASGANNPEALSVKYARLATANRTAAAHEVPLVWRAGNSLDKS